MIKRLENESCAGVIIDVQTFFLESLTLIERERIEAGTEQLVSLLDYLKIPIVFTVERPLKMKGQIPVNINGTKVLEKDFFDLTRESEIVQKIAALKRKQIIIAGCETDVCVLQSCLGLLSLGYEVFVIEDLLFSSTDSVDSAKQRMRDSGAVLLTFKSLFHELLQAVRGSSYRQEIERIHGPLPEILSAL